MGVLWSIFAYGELDVSVFIFQRLDMSNRIGKEQILVHWITLFSLFCKPATSKFVYSDMSHNRHTSSDNAFRHGIAKT